MKKLCTILAVLALMVLCAVLMPTEVNAASESDLTFALINNGTEYEVTRCSFAASGELEIPATYNGKPVTSVGKFAFEGCDDLSSITIPDSVTSIGNYAFYNCTSLTSVILGDGVTNIGGNAFSNCISLKYNVYDLAKYLGTANNPYAFLFSAKSTGIESVQIHKNAKVIGDSAFYDCEWLASVTIPDSVTSIGAYAFYNCRSLTSVTIGDGVTSIGNYAFAYDWSLTSVTIGDSVSCIGDWAFALCDMTSVIIPDSVTSLGDYTFCGCTSLTSVTIGNSVTSIGNSAFSDCYLLTSIAIPDSVTKIDDSAFARCVNLWHVLYSGTEAWWNTIAIEDATELENATIHFNCTGEEEIDPFNKVCTVCACLADGSHQWGAGSVTKPATCKETGIKTYTCSVCKTTNTQSIAKLTTHTYDNACDTACNVCGSTRTVKHQYGNAWSKDANEHWHVCTICNSKGDQAAHTPGAAATETTAQTCTRCGYVIQAALDHTHHYESSWSADASSHWHTCACGAQGDVAAHSWNDGEEITPATCKETGVMIYTCTVCDATKTEEIAKLTTHTPGAEATETTPQVCTVCGKELNPAIGTTPPATEPLATEPPATEPTATEPTAAPTQPVANAQPQGESFPVGIVIAIVVIVVAAAGVIIFKKKH